MITGNYIRFDWAMKRMLRQKANFAVLEGLLTTLLGEKVTIRRLLESESNKDDEEDKSNRVDMLAEMGDGSLVLIEVQNNTEYAYFQRMLFGTSKLVTEYVKSGQGYENVRKVYSINIVYFNLGGGTDYVYHGTTEFRGLHNGELLRLSPFQARTFRAGEVSDIFPEYYVLKVNDFNRIATTPLEEWIRFLSTGDILGSDTAPGLAEAREHLRVASMTKEARRAYMRHVDNLVILRDGIEGSKAEARFEGREEGLAEGREEGLAEGKQLMIRRMLDSGMPRPQVAAISGVAEGELPAN